ncbi:Crp/Fnr family transcriptional regulator [Phenylobacterium sp.]|jgi:CRP-like cAMP-binding protein|uniref:Crp/Fnr family transcriptional regulator n=1 Tax=Phenylobacterium sp. TaxID=1871053 RepID=UPI002F93279F
MSGRFLANLLKYVELSAAEQEVVEGLVAQRRSLPAGAEVFREGEASSDCRLLLDGQAFRHKNLSDGRRQILSFHVPGDLLDLQRAFQGMEYSATTLTPCEIGLAPRTALLAAMGAHPKIAHGLWRLSLMESAIYREWMVGMGRRTAYARIAHLLCEQVTRLKTAGLMQGERARFPATQAHLADSLGLSVVHTNRVLQALRAEGLVELRGRELVVLDWKGLCAAGEFDSAYLNLGRRAA